MNEVTISSPPAIEDALCSRNLSEPSLPPGSTHNIAVAVFSSLLAIVILVGNGLIIVSVCLVRKLRQPANYLIVSLAFSDFLVAFIVLPLTVVYDILGEWVFGSTLCNFHVSMDVICCATSILNLVMISVDRYLMITRPFWYPKKRTAKLMGSMIVCVWVLACLIIFPALFGFTKNVTDEPDWFNLTLTNEFQLHPTMEAPFNATIANETVLYWTPCSHERIWQITVDLKWEHDISEIRAMTLANSDLLFRISMIRANGSKIPQFDRILTPPSINKEIGGVSARFIRIFMNDTLKQHFANTSFDLHADRVGGKNCLISQEVWFTIYSTLSSFYIPLGVMLFMYYKIYLEASRLEARQRARSLSDDSSLKVNPTKGWRRKPIIVHDDSSSDIIDYKFEMHRRNSSNQTTSSKAHDNEHTHRQAVNSRDDEACPILPPSDKYNDSNILPDADNQQSDRNVGTSYEVNGNLSENLKEQCEPKHGRSWCRNLQYSSSSVSHSDGSGLISQSSRRKGSYHRGSNASTTKDTENGELPIGRSILSTRRRSFRSRKLSIPFRRERKRSSFLRRNFSVQREKMRNVKAIRTLGIIVVVFTFCWLPFFVLTFLRPFICQNPESFDCLPSWLVRLVLWLGYLNSAMNPLIYVGFNSELRDTFILLLLCKCSNVDRRLARGEVRRAIENEKKHNAAL